MAPLRLALNQLNVTVGDIDGNADKIVSWTRHAAERGAHLAAFPQMALTGYPVEDLALRRSFVDASQAGISKLAARLADEGLGETVVVCGYLDRALGAALLAAGLDGIANKRDPGERLDIDMYEDGHRLKNVKRLPLNLLDALRLTGVAYLVKPFDDERLAAALQHARSRLASPPGPRADGGGPSDRRGPPSAPPGRPARRRPPLPFGSGQR